MPDLAPSAAPRELQWQLQQKCGSTLSYWWRLMDITMDSDGQLDIISPIYPQECCDDWRWLLVHVVSTLTFLTASAMRQRVRLADHQLLSLRQVRSQSPGVQTSWDWCWDLEILAALAYTMIHIIILCNSYVIFKDNQDCEAPFYLNNIS